MDLYKKRSLVVVVIFLTVLVMFAGKLFSLQILDKKYKDLANQNVIRKLTVRPSRGLIYDRNGKLLVVNDANYEIHVIPRQVEQMDTALFCQLLDIDKEFFEAQLKKAYEYSRYRPSKFLKQVSARQFSAFQEYLYKFPGFFGQIDFTRKYPYPVAAHVLGYVGEVTPRTIEQQPYYVSGDYIGISGLEYTYESFLRGHKGSKTVMVDRFNREVGSFAEGMYDSAAISGHNIHVSIDIELQAYAEQLMQNKKGCVVAIEPSTGEILCMVSSPTFDPNLLSGRKRGKNFAMLMQDTLKPLFNRPIMGSTYPPGSTFKPVQALIGLQEGTLSTTDAYPCYPGYRMGSHTVGCHMHPVARNLSTAIQHSCNAYFCYVFRNIVDQEKFENMDQALALWNQYIYSFGLGQKLGVDVPNEEKGLVPTPAVYNKMYSPGSWKSSTIISLSIGQGELGVTPLQLANMTCIFANRGYYYTPHFATKIDNDTTGHISEYTERHYTKVDAKYFDPIVEGLYQTCEQGTGRIARIEGYEVCGKTGTVQNPHGEDHSAFITFAPKDNPKIAVAVFVENSGFGSTYAAPIASLVMEKYLNDTISDKRIYLQEKMLNADLITPKKKEVEQ